MRKVRNLLIINIMLCFSVCVFSQNTEYQKAIEYLNRKGEVYFKFNISSKNELQELTSIISIDNVLNLEVFAYANENQFKKFIELNYAFTVLSHPGDAISAPKMYTSGLRLTYNYDSYPTYDAYLTLMNDFKNSFPDLCEIIDIGTSVKGRKILFAKISKNVNSTESEPKFLYTSSMHGDETAGYITMLHLINYLLTNYGIDQTITNLLDSTEIWINPLANPDGTYASGNNTVSGATRYNANYVDLNRNFPDPLYGDHPDGNSWQPETQAFMNLANAYHYVIAANFHGGAEVVSYPWDSNSERHADDNWYQFVSHKYADIAQTNSPAGYMNGFNDGITNGYDWYEVDGGRQDYMNYYQQCREVTIELSDIKLLPESQLNNIWNYNYHSLLSYMKEAHYGIKGNVTDGTTHEPIKAEIFVNNHDNDNSHIYSGSQFGDFYRPIYSGNYSITISADNYISKNINIEIQYEELISLDIKLYECFEDLIISNPLEGGNTEFYANNSIIATNIISGSAIVSYSANNSIKLQTGFKVLNSCSFHADLNGCTGSSLKSAKIEEYATNIADRKVAETVFDTKNIKLSSDNVILYPNPTTGILLVEGLTEFEALVFDPSGRVLFKGTHAKTNIDISHLRPGIYMVHLKSAGKTYKFKIVKQ